MVPKYDQKVPPNWKPVETLAQRKCGMDWSDRFWYWLLSLAGLGMIAAGVAIAAYLHFAKISGLLIASGLVVFFLGSPSQAARNGYRSS